MRKGPMIFWSIFIAAAFFRVAQSFGVDRPNAGACVKQIVSGRGIVDGDPEIKDSGQILTVSVSAMQIASSSSICEADFLLRMKTKSYPRFGFGDYVSFKGRLLRPVNFSSEGDTGKSFDYEGYLAKSDIFFEMKSAQVDPVPTDDGGLRLSPANILDRVKKGLFSLKRRFVSNLKKVLGEPHAALASGLVVGEKASLGNDLLDDFRTVGLVHIIVLSGFNITIVGNAIRKVFSSLPRIWGILIGGIGIILFGILVGGGATVVRSCFMAGIALSANIIRRDYDVTRALIFAGLIMVIQNPMILFHDPSFQLSFLATFGLITLSSPIEKCLRFITDRFGIRAVVAATLSTQLFVSPYILYTMGNLSIIGVVVNILVLPFIPVTMFFVFTTGTLGMISSSIAELSAWITYPLLSYELFLVRFFARLPFASIHISHISKWLVGTSYAVFLVVWIIIRYGRDYILSNRSQLPDEY